MRLADTAILQHRYHLVRELGSGGMGTVYLAEDMRLGGRPCAVKEHRPDPSLDPVDLAKLRRQFEQRETRILAELDHPNLPKVFDYFTDGGNDYLVMEYVAGDNLHTELTNHMKTHGRPIPEKVALLWADRVLDALHYLHTRPTGAIIHRDIKPANIILTNAGRIKLVDFGLAKLIEPAGTSVTSRSLSLLTPQYAPPEQFMLGVMDERSDIFSFGATLYHLLSGAAPPSAQERAFGEAEMRPVVDLCADVSSVTSQTLIHACALRKDDRILFASDMREALAKARMPSVRDSGAVPTTKHPAISESNDSLCVDDPEGLIASGLPPQETVAPQGTADELLLESNGPRPSRSLMAVGLTEIVLGMLGLGGVPLDAPDELSLLVFFLYPVISGCVATTIGLHYAHRSLRATSAMSLCVLHGVIAVGLMSTSGPSMISIEYATLATMYAIVRARA